jgi:hypothetical protein
MKVAKDLHSTIDDMEEDISSILDFTYILIGLTEGNEIEPVHDLILLHGHSLRKRWDEARLASGRLATS